VSRTLQHFFWKIISSKFFSIFFQVLCLLLRRSFQCLCEFQHLVPAAEAPLSSGVTLGRVLRFTQAVPCNWSFNLWPTKTGIFPTKIRYATVIEQQTVGYINRNNENLGTSPEFDPQDVHHLLFHSCTIVLALILTYKACRLGGKASDPPGVATQIGPDSFKNASTIPASFNELDAPISHEGALLLYQGLGINLE